MPARTVEKINARIRLGKNEILMLLKSKHGLVFTQNPAAGTLKRYSIVDATRG
mgnify:CR=1 FL=1